MDLSSSAAQQPALLTLQARCLLEDVSPPRTVLSALVQTWEGLPAVAKLRRVKGERDAVEVKHEAFPKALSVVAEIPHRATERLLRQQHKLASRYSQIAGLLSSTGSGPASRPLERGSSSTDSTHLLPLRHPRPS